MGVVASRGARRRRALLAAIVLIAAGGQVADARADGVVGYVDAPYAPVPSSPTGSKPESKLWYGHGSWWAVMADAASQSQHIFRLARSTEEWTDTGVVVDTRANARADTLWDKAHDKLYVASHEYAATGAPTAASPGAVWRFSYDKAAGGYRLDPGFPVPVNAATSETLVIDMDSLGRLWATWTQENQVYVAHATDAGNATWVAPYVIPTPDASTTVNNDDISTLVAFDEDKIGVMWSNQRDRNDYFAVHVDAAGDDAGGWTTTPVPIDATFPVATFPDDHFNLKADGKGRVYAVVKHSTDDWLEPDTPFTSLLVREPDGTWSRHTVTTTTERHTRSIVELDTDHRVIHVFDTGPTPPGRSGDGGGTIYEKTSSMDAISFAPGHGDPILGGSGTGLVMNDVTSTKQNLSSKIGLVVLAHDSKAARYWHADQTLGGAFTLPPSRTTSGAPEREGPTVQPDPEPVAPPPAPPAPPGPAGTPPAGRQIVLRPIADGSVSSGRPAARSGRSAALRVRRGRPAYRTYLKFRVSGITGRITAARLRLRAAGPDRGGAVLVLASNRWNETMLTWRVSPRAIGSQRVSVPAAARPGVVEIDVRPIVTGPGTFTLALSGARGSGATYSSREGRTAPQLVLTVG